MRSSLPIIAGILLFALAACGPDDASESQSSADAGPGDCQGGCTTDGGASALWFTAPAPNSLVYLESLEVTGNIASNSQISSLVVLANGQQVDSTQFSPSSFSATVPVPRLDGEKLAIVARATDVAGNMIEQSVEVLVDRVAPEVVLESPAEGAAFNAGAPSTFSLKGTVSDGTLELAEIALDGGDFEPLELGDGGAFLRSVPLADENGVSHSVLIHAVDRAGHNVSLERSYLVDRVAPTVSSVPVDGQRNVACEAILFELSEPMDLESVRQATTLNGVPVGDALGSTDGRRFGLSGCTQMPPYSVLDLAVATTARDPAGNQLAQAFSARFKSAPKMPTQSDVISAARYPSLAVDSDGIPFLAYWNDTGKTFEVAWWNGKDAFVRSPQDIPTTMVAPCKRPVQLLLEDRQPTDSLDLLRDFEVVFCGRTASAFNNGDLYYVKNSLPSLDYLLPGQAVRVDSASLDGSPRIQHRWDLSSNTIIITYAKVNGDGEDIWDEIWERTWSAGYGWNPSQLVTNTFGTLGALGGDAFTMGSAIYVAAGFGQAASSASAFSVFGTRPLWGDLSDTDTGYIKSAWVVWANSQSNQAGIACAKSGTTAWKQAQVGGMEASQALREVYFEIGDPYSAFAAEGSGDRVFVKAFQNDDCSSPPVQVQDDALQAVLENAKEPAAIVVNGKLWVAAVDSTSGSLFVVPPVD